MAAELKDFRGKLTAETDCVLEAISRAEGRDKQEIVREVMHGWAVEKLHVHKVLAKLLAAEGIAGSDEGTSGNRRV